MTTGMIIGAAVMLALYLFVGFASIRYRRAIKERLVTIAFNEGRALGKKVRTAKRRRLRKHR